jgi:hypothetical protein
VVEREQFCERQRGQVEAERDLKVWRAHDVPGREVRTVGEVTVTGRRLLVLEQVTAFGIPSPVAEVASTWRLLQRRHAGHTSVPDALEVELVRPGPGGREIVETWTRTVDGETPHRQNLRTPIGAVTDGFVPAGDPVTETVEVAGQELTCQLQRYGRQTTNRGIVTASALSVWRASSLALPGGSTGRPSGSNACSGEAERSSWSPCAP